MRRVSIRVDATRSIEWVAERVTNRTISQYVPSAPTRDDYESCDRRSPSWPTTDLGPAVYRSSVIVKNRRNRPPPGGSVAGPARRFSCCIHLENLEVGRRVQGEKYRIWTIRFPLGGLS